MKIGVINGPNINLLGKREIKIYGNKSWESVEQELKEYCEKKQIQLSVFQSNHEGEIVDYIQKNINLWDAVIINPAAFTKGGYSILDALNSNSIPYIEVHISNIFARGSWHAESIFFEHARGIIVGLGCNGYMLALQTLELLFVAPDKGITRKYEKDKC